MALELTRITDQALWDTYVSQSPWGHPLQLWGWGESKRSTNWEPHRLALSKNGHIVAVAQVLLWPIPKLGKMIAYVPRGPIVDPKSAEAAELLTELTAWAKDHDALYLRIEPAWTLNDFRSSRITSANLALRAHRTAEYDSLAVLDSSRTASTSESRNLALLPKGWKKARHGIQLAETYTIDLAKSEDELQEAMIRKHRQYIRKAEREGVVIRRETLGNTSPMYQLYLETAARAGFGIHTEHYYHDLFAQLGEANWLYYAEVNGKPEGFLWLAAAGATAYELYGGISAAGGEDKVNYGLKWRAITDLKAAGYQIYDFNGRLNEGVSQFKAGFGPDETDFIGTYDFVLNKLGYAVWESLWPVAKPIGRRIMKAVKR